MPREDIKAEFVNAKIPRYAVFNLGKMIGFINVELDYESKMGKINSIGVLLEWRGRGLGKYLLNFGVQHLRELGAEEITLSVAAANQKALQLYLNTGFKIQEEFSIFRKDLTLSSKF